MTSERLGEMFKGDSADTCAGKFQLVSMGGRADTSNERRREARTPIGASGNSKIMTLYQNEKLGIQVVNKGPSWVLIYPKAVHKLPSDHTLG